ncbi:MAG: hypothetical protein V4650_12710 [Pseudomonadota bacterium]
MPTFSDIQLMAYADGELPSDEAAAITAALATDSQLAQRIEQFAASRRALKQAFALPATAAALSPALLKLLAPPAAAAPSRNAVRRRSRWPMALAASLLLGLGVMSGYKLLKHAADNLSLALETLPSGEIHRTAEGEIVALSTLAAGDGSLCREYERSNASSSQRGLACREGEGQWRERVLAAPAALPPDAGGYQLAGGETVDAATALKARRLSLEEERQRLLQGWR